MSERGVIWLVPPVIAGIITFIILRRGNSRNLSLALASGTAIAFIVLFLETAIRRIGYPFELEWLEGVLALQAERISSGQNPYPLPSAGFMPLNYPPFFQALGAPLISAGLSPLFSLRLISLASAICWMALSGIIVGKATSDRAWGIVAAGMYASAYASVGAWYDLARVDSLWVLLVGVALALVWNNYSSRRAALSCVALIASLFCKQPSILFVFPITAAIALKSRKAAWWYFVSTLAGLMLGAALIEAVTHYYTFYTIATVKGSPWLFDQFISRWGYAVKRFPFEILLGLIAVRGVIREKRPLNELRLSGGGVMAAIIATASMFMKKGAYPNDVMITLALGILFVFTVLKPRPAFAILAIVAMMSHFYLPGRAMVPTATDAQAGRRFIEQLKSMPRPFFLPSHPYYAWLAGERETPNLMSLQVNKYVTGKYPQALMANIEEKRYRVIILDYPMNFAKDELLDSINRNYALSGNIFDHSDDSTFWTVAGWKTRPSFLYLPR